MRHPHKPLSDRRPTPIAAIDRREALRRIALATFAVPASAAAWTTWLGGALPCAAAAAVPAMLQPATLKASLDWTVPAADPLTAIKIILSGLLGEIPVVGWALDLLLNLFWPTPKPGDPPLPDLWSIIKDEVQALINEDIDTFYNGELNDDIAGLKGDLDNYRIAAAAATMPNGTRPDPEIIQNLIAYAAAVQTTFTTLMPRFTGRSADSAWKVLPLYVQAANLHLAFLADIIRSGPTYGLEQSLIGIYATHWHDAMKPENADSGTGYINFVTATMAQAKQQFASDYANSKANWRGINPPDIGYATALPLAWPGKKQQNARLNEYTLVAQDFLDVWKGLQDPSQPIDPNHPPTVLGRILWYGPYGQPDGHDIGLQFRYHRAGGDRYTIDVPVTILAGTLEVPTPPATPDTALSGVHFDEMTYQPISSDGNTGPISPGGPVIEWKLPQGFKQYRGGVAPPQAGGFNMTIDEANPVVSVKVHTCDYSSWWNKTDIPVVGVVHTLDPSAGTLIGGIEFVRADNSAAIAGDSEQLTSNCCDGTVYEITANATESLAVANHVLCNFFRPSAVYQLWDNVIGGDIGGDPWTTGSMMFAFRLRDPTLTPPASLLARAYVSSPQPLSASAIAELAAAWYRRRGSELSDDALVELGAILLGIIEDEGLDAEREAYWNNVAVFVEAHTPPGSRQLPRLGSGTSPHVGRPIGGH